MLLRLRLPLLLLILGLGAGCPVAGPADRSVWQSFEETLPFAVEAANPFDPTEVRVDVELRGPGAQRVWAPAFLYQGFDQTRLPDGRERLTASGDREWRFRFTPTRAGEWRWRWQRTTAAGVETGPWVRFAVSENLDPTRHGFVRASKDPRYLAFEDGTPFVPVGENLSWYDHRGTFAYEDWMAKLAASGANYVRLWMPSWAMGLVYAPATLEDWSARMDRAWQLDRVLELAEQHGLYVMLAVQNHGPFSLTDFFGSGWGTNLFNEDNGGPLATPSEFWTDPEAREIFRRYLRYVAARWGHSPHLFAFELWNEGNLAEQPETIDPVLDWHREMAGVLRDADPNDHLVTTSTTDELMTFAAWLRNIAIETFPLAWEPVWQLPEIDFVQLHSYQIFGWGVFMPVARTLGTLMDRMAQYGKPVLLAEAGVDFQGIAETLAADPDGEGFHDLVWAGVFNGGLGSGMSWWWDFVVDTEDWYFHFAHLSRLLAGVDFPRERFARSREAVDGATRVFAHALAGRTTLLVWVKNVRHQYYNPDHSLVSGASFAPPLALGGVWRGEWLDPWTGAVLGPAELDTTTAKGAPVLPIPSFSRDVALRLERVLPK